MPAAQKHRAISRQEKMAFSTPVGLSWGSPPPPTESVRTDGRTDVRMYGRTDVRMDGHVTITSQPKFLGLIGYQISLAMELRWRALPAGSAIKNLAYEEPAAILFTSATRKKKGIPPPPVRLPWDSPPPPPESVRTDGRMDGWTYGDVRTNIFRINGLPNLLTHGAPRAPLLIVNLQCLSLRKCPNCLIQLTIPRPILILKKFYLVSQLQPMY